MNSLATTTNRTAAQRGQLLSPPLKLMLVDDKDLSHFIMRKFIAMHLPNSTAVHTYTDPVKALNEIESINPDIIYLDLCLPMVDHGYRFLEEMENRNLPQKVIILTAAVDQESRRRSFEYSNVVDFISKPITPQDLFRSIKINA